MPGEKCRPAQPEGDKWPQAPRELARSAALDQETRRRSYSRVWPCSALQCGNDDSRHGNGKLRQSKIHRNDLVASATTQLPQFAEHVFKYCVVRMGRNVGEGVERTVSRLELFGFLGYVQRSEILVSRGRLVIARSGDEREARLHCFS